MTEITWKIVSLDRAPEMSGLTDVVCRAHWEVLAIDPAYPDLAGRVYGDCA
ncbi:hypothetical protein H2509_00840, partial [Stappia sp. F7233]|nr:hypothetical protein [Stappia albiluteola]